MDSRHSKKNPSPKPRAVRLYSQYTDITWNTLIMSICSPTSHDQTLWEILSNYYDFVGLKFEIGITSCYLLYLYIYSYVVFACCKEASWDTVQKAWWWLIIMQHLLKFHIRINIPYQHNPAIKTLKNTAVNIFSNKLQYVPHIRMEFRILPHWHWDLSVLLIKHT